MKRHILPAAIVVLFAALAGNCIAESPEAFALRFFTDEESSQIKGLPDEGDNLKLDRFLGMELIRAIREAKQAVAQWRKSHQPSKESLMVPHIHFCLFDGFDEGPTTFRIGMVWSRLGKQVVEIHREHREGPKVTSWTDHLILDRDSAGWVISDIDTHYYGSSLDWIRSFRDRLSEELSNAGK